MIYGIKISVDQNYRWVDVNLEGWHWGLKVSRRCKLKGSQLLRIQQVLLKLAYVAGDVDAWTKRARGENCIWHQDCNTIRHTEEIYWRKIRSSNWVEYCNRYWIHIINTPVSLCCSASGTFCINIPKLTQLLTFKYFLHWNILKLPLPNSIVHLVPVASLEFLSLYSSNFGHLFFSLHSLSFLVIFRNFVASKSAMAVHFSKPV